MIFPNETILDPDNGPSGFATPDFTMAAVPVIGSNEYCIIAFGTQHEYCKDRKTAEIKLEQLWKATRKGQKGTKTPAKRKSRKKSNSLILNPCGGKGSSVSDVPDREQKKVAPPKQNKKIPNGKMPKSKSVTKSKPHTLHPNPLLDALS
jgi:hypothetical protein